MKMDTSRVRVCDILMVDTSDLLDLDLRGCFNTTDQCVMDVINRCPKLESIDLESCSKESDAGVSALGAGCGQLQSIYLGYCNKVTDADISVGCRVWSSAEYSSPWLYRGDRYRYISVGHRMWSAAEH